MKKRILSVLLCLAMTVGVLTGCSRGDNSGTQNNNETSNQESQSQSDNGGNQGAAQQKGRVYYLSFKPESDRVWQDLAAQYTQETGVPVKVVTPPRAPNSTPTVRWFPWPTSISP